MQFDKPFHFHIELTDKCQALCPQCGRTGIDHQGNLFQQPYIKKMELSLEQYKKIFEGWNHPIREILFCGNYGDPLLAKDFLEIVKYSIETLKVETTTIHTNGSLRDSKWWTQLGETLSKHNHVVEFTLDGINQETHSMYRVNTDFDKIIKNAQSFIKAGGSATWKFVSFSHSQHQVDDARKMAKELGFHYFVNEPSKRGFGQNNVMIFKKDNKRVELRPSPKAVSQVSNNKKQGVIECIHKAAHSVYIRCDGEIYPCCYLGGYTVPNHHITNARKSTNALTMPLSECIEKELLINRVNDLISSPHPTCVAVCGHKTRQTEKRDSLREINHEISLY